MKANDILYSSILPSLSSACSLFYPPFVACSFMIVFIQFEVHTFLLLLFLTSYPVYSRHNFAYHIRKLTRAVTNDYFIVN